MTARWPRLGERSRPHDAATRDALAARAAAAGRSDHTGATGVAEAVLRRVGGATEDGTAVATEGVTDSCVGADSPEAPVVEIGKWTMEIGRWAQGLGVGSSASPLGCGEPGRGGHGGGPAAERGDAKGDAPSEGVHAMSLSQAAGPVIQLVAKQ